MCQKCQLEMTVVLQLSRTLCGRLLPDVESIGGHKDVIRGKYGYK